MLRELLEESSAQNTHPAGQDNKIYLKEMKQGCESRFAFGHFGFGRNEFGRNELRPYSWLSPGQIYRWQPAFERSL